MTSRITPALIEQFESMLPACQSDFDAVLSDKKVTYAQEAAFAIQALTANSFLGNMARSNPDSLKNAILNVAAIGTTLNPTEKKAYLVPRKGVVCLDLSYRGLADLAVESGACEWIDAKLVYSNDDYTPSGMGSLPDHKPANPFKGGRGDLIGVYAAAKRPDGSYAVVEMPIEDVHKIRARSESAKKGSGPWKTDYEQMVLKTPIKQIVKRLQGTNKRIDNAIQLLNDQGEGIDFNNEIKQHPRDVNASAESQDMVNGLLKQNSLEWDANSPMANAIGANVESVAELTELQCGKLIGMLEARLRNIKRQQTQQQQPDNF